MNDDSRVDKMNEKLYSKTRYREPIDKRSGVLAPDDTSMTEGEWKSPSIDDMIQSDRRTGERRSFMRSTLNKVFVGALLFCILALGAAAYIYFAGANFISSKNVDITVRGPVSISAGGVLDLDVTIVNKNNADLEDVSLGISYPTGTRDATDTTKSLTYNKESIGNINAGKEVTKSLTAVVYGEQGEAKQIKFSLDYKVKGSNATFNKEKIYDISVGSVPVTMVVEEPATVKSGDVFTTKVTLTTNSTEILQNVLMRGEYPYGFTVIDSNPKALNANSNLWNLGDLSPGDTKTITIQGKLLGQDTEERTFRFSAGVSAPQDPERFDTALATAAHTISINRPEVGLELVLNGNSGAAYVAPAGRVVNADIKLANNMPGRLSHVRIVAKLSGPALDRFSVVAQGGGFYDSGNNQIVWDETTSPGLANLSAGDSGLFSFQFASLATLSPGQKNQEISVSATASGVPEDAAPISIAEARTVKIASEVTLTVKPVYSRGAFKNSGPVPPKAEKTTTYTLVLNLKNTQNDIFKPTLTATLGPNVKWLGAVSPAGENIVYSSTTNTVTWTLATLPSGTGFSEPIKEAAFQVSLTPSIGQIGSAPVLLNALSFRGQDVFTNSPVTISLPSVTTRIDSDPKYVQGDETVVK